MRACCVSSTGKTPRTRDPCVYRGQVRSPTTGLASTSRRATAPSPSTCLRDPRACSRFWPVDRRGGAFVVATAFAALFSVVGLALYGLPLYYDFMVREFGWSRTMVTSGNAISKLVVGPLFGFGAGWIVDRFGPRRLMMAGILMAGGALVGLGLTSAAWAFFFFFFFNSLCYVCACCPSIPSSPLPLCL